MSTDKSIKYSHTVSPSILTPPNNGALLEALQSILPTCSSHFDHGF